MSDKSAHEEYISVGEAAQRLGVSKGTMAKWIREGYIKAEASPRDRRFKLVPVSEVERLTIFPKPEAQKKERAA